jgi:hypothetical protein
MIHFPNANNPLYGGRDQFLPADYPTNPDSSNHMIPQAIGILETQGLTAILKATDAMLKATDVKFVGKEKIGAAYVTAVVSRKIIASPVIARPHDDWLALLPK